MSVKVKHIFKPVKRRTVTIGGLKFKPPPDFELKDMNNKKTTSFETSISKIKNTNTFLFLRPYNFVNNLYGAFKNNVAISDIYSTLGVGN